MRKSQKPHNMPSEESMARFYATHGRRASLLRHGSTTDKKLPCAECGERKSRWETVLPTKSIHYCSQECLVDSLNEIQEDITPEVVHSEWKAEFFGVTVHPSSGIDSILDGKFTSNFLDL